ncbi:MAG: DUF6324 family protein, partial [Gemmobacter sp.]
MGIDDDSDIAGNLQIGPTTLGMVRIHVEGGGISLPLDFEPDEAEESYQQAFRGLKGSRSSAAGAAPGFEQEYRDALTQAMDALTGQMQRG